MIRLDELPAEIIEQIAFHLALLSDRPQPTHLPALLSTSSRFNTCLNFTRNPVFYARLFRHHYDINAISRRLGGKTLDAHALAAEYKQRALRIKSISTNTLDHDHLLNLWTIYLLLIENDGKNILILQGINVLRYLDYLASQPSLPLYHPHDDYPPNTPAHALALHIRNILLDLPRLHSQHARDTLSYQLRPFVFAAHKFDAFVAPWTYDHLPLGSAARSNHLIEVEAAQHPQEQSPYLADLTPREKIHEIPYCGGILRLAPPNPVLPACQMFFGLIEQDQDVDEEEDDDEELEQDPAYALTTESTQDDRSSSNTRALTANALHQALVKGDINLEQLTDTLQAAAALASVSSSGSQRVTSLSLPSDAGAIAAAAVAASVALNNARYQASSSSSSETETSALATVLDELDTQAFDLSGSIDWRRGASSSAFLSPLLQRQQRGSTEAPAQEEIFTEQEGEGGEQRNDDVWLALAQALALLREGGDSAHSSVAAAILDRAREVPPPPQQQQKLQSPTPTRIFPTSQTHDLDFHRLSSCLSPFLSPGLPPTHFSSHFTGTWEGRFAFFDFDSYRAMLASGSVRELMGEGQYGEQAQVWKLEEKVVKVRRRRVDLERGRERARWRGGWVGSEEMHGEEEDDDVAEEGQGDDDDMEEVEEIAISGVGHSAWGHFVLRGHVRSWDGLVSLVKEYCPDGRGRWRYRGYLVAGGHLVGRWRDTFSPPQYIGYEGCFLLKKREGGGLDSGSVC